MNKELVAQMAEAMRLHGIPYTEEAYKALVELAEEMRDWNGWPVHTTFDIRVKPEGYY